MIPAWEANDELDHVANIEYEVRHFGTFIPIDYGRWHETHQPPLYYWIGAIWQRMLGITSFTPSFPPWRATKPENDKLVFAHEKFDAVQRSQALSLHKLRLLSPILGLITVALTFSICRSLTCDQLFAASATFIVALHPKFLILSAAITNDSLAVLVGSTLLLLTIRYVSDNRGTWHHHLLALGIGLTAGAGVLTKLNLLPLIGILISIAVFLAPSGWRGKLADSLIIVLVGLLVCGWWLFHNRALYGDWLAMRASSDWLALRLPKTMKPVPFYDVERFLNFVPQTLFRTFWYNGGFNQLVAPFAIYCVLWWLAAVSLAQAFKVQIISKESTLSTQHLSLLWAATLAGAVAVLLIAQQTFQAEGRIAFVALPAFAVLLTSGSQAYFRGTRFHWLGLSLWPLVMLLFNAYVLLRFILPHRQL
ncbi:hypothetical protein BH20VER3_BH20VER3_08550 [soil metagenome]